MRSIRFLVVLLTLLPITGCDGTDSPADPQVDSQAEYAQPEAGVSPVPDPRVTIATVRNGTAYNGLPVRFESFDAPGLRELRERERLDEVIAGAKQPFERALLLKDWVAAQWPHSNPNPYPPWNANIILDWIRSGKTGGFCGQYSQVLLQSLASVGMTARYVEIGGDWNPVAHFVIEVWSNQYNKWVVLDADYNIHFERDGIPLSALEVHDALLGGTLADVQVIKGSFMEGHYDAYDWPLKTAELYYYLRVHLKADHLSVPDEEPFDRYNDMVEFRDARVLAWEDTADAYSYPTYRLTNLQTYHRDELRGELNQTFLDISSVQARTITINMDNSVRDFDHYEWRTVGQEGMASEWTDTTVPYVEWVPDRNRLVIEVRGVNRLGVAGPASSFSAAVARQPARIPSLD
jgi:hypothetical protein